MKIIFIQNTFGEPSETFLYRMCTVDDYFESKILTGRRINVSDTPFDDDRIILWEQKTGIKQNLVPRLNRKFRLAGTYSEYSSKIIDEINDSDADIACFQLSTVAIYLGKEIKKIRKKICIIHHGTDINKAYEDPDLKKRLSVAWKAADKLIFTSQFLLKNAISLGCPKDKSIINYLGVPLQDHQKRNVAKESSVFRFICVARFIPVKNHLKLIEAFAQTLESTNRPIELVLVGDGESKPEIVRAISKLGIQEHIQMLGLKNNESTLHEVSKSDCIVLVSSKHIIAGEIYQEESLGISLLEGASFGLPMIGSDSGGIPEVVKDGYNGYIVDPDNPADISHAMKMIIENPEETVRLGENARDTVENSFNFDKQMETFCKIFDSVLSGR